MRRTLFALLTINALTGAAPVLAGTAFPDVLIGRWLPANECGRDEEHSVIFSPTSITFYEETFVLRKTKQNGPRTYVFSGRWNVHGEISNADLTVRLSADQTNLAIDGYARAENLVRCPIKTTASRDAAAPAFPLSYNNPWMFRDA